MKDLLPDWQARLSAAKQTLKDKGEIAGDTDVAQRVTELLQTIEQPEVERGAINHWLNRKRQPNVAQFVALCFALKVKPSDAIDNEYPVDRNNASHAVHDLAALYQFPESELTEFIALLSSATPEARRIAIAAAKAVLASATKPDQSSESVA